MKGTSELTLNPEKTGSVHRMTEHERILGEWTCSAEYLNVCVEAGSSVIPLLGFITFLSAARLCTLKRNCGSVSKTAEEARQFVLWEEYICHCRGVRWQSLACFFALANLLYVAFLFRLTACCGCLNSLIGVCVAVRLSVQADLSFESDLIGINLSKYTKEMSNLDEYGRLLNN